MQTTLEDEGATRDLAKRIAIAIKPGDILFLEGDLGAGKTTFARALVQALSGDDTMAVPSPTFTLVQSYETKKGQLWHFDFYRLEDPYEIYEIGWEEALCGGIIIAEWPERLGTLSPDSYYKMTFKVSPPSLSRIVTLTPMGEDNKKLVEWKRAFANGK